MAATCAVGARGSGFAMPCRWRSPVRLATFLGDAAWQTTANLDQQCPPAEVVGWAISEWRADW